MNDVQFVTDIWRRGLRPSPAITVSEWADANRVLPPTSAEPGPWRTSRTPYLAEIMNALSEGTAFERIVVMAGSQVGKSESGLNFLGWMIDHAPGLALLVMPSLDMTKRNVRTRIDPMINNTPRLAELVGPPRAKDGTNSLFLKEFPGGQLVMTGANAGNALRSTPARYLFLDEIDAYPGDVDNEGDPVDLAIRRTTTFRSTRKILMVSTPTIAGASRIEAAYFESDRRQFHVPCLQCGHMAPVSWSRIQWPEGEREQAYMVCDKCGGITENADKPKILARGRWIATATGDGKTAGFHLPGLYSPFESWGSQVVEHGKVKNDPSRLQVWVNTVLAETWQDVAAEAMQEDGLLARREPWTGRLPEKVVLLTAGVDVQGDRIEVQVIGWAPGEESWIVAYEILPGDPTGDTVWRQLDAYLGRTFEHSLDVPHLTIRATCIDTGGSATRAAYNFIRTRHGRQIWGIKGANTPGAPAWPRKPSNQNKGKVPLYSIGVDALKDTIAARLTITDPGPGCIHFPSFLTAQYFSQLTAEQRKTKFVRGRPQRYWEPKTKGARNEALDTFGYALAALTGLTTLGINLEAEKERIELAAAGKTEPAPTKVKSKFMRR